MAELGVSAAAGPILLAWAGKGLSQSPGDDSILGDFDLNRVLEALKSAGHFTAGFGQVVAAFMGGNEKLAVGDIEDIISRVALTFDTCESK